MKLLWLVIFALVLAITFNAIRLASASPSCLTMNEARARYPDQHLYWHGQGHCWDASPKRHPTIHRHVPTLQDEPPRVVFDSAPPPVEAPATDVWSSAVEIGVPIKSDVAFIVYNELEYNPLDAALDAQQHIKPMFSFLSLFTLIAGISVMVFSVGTYVHRRPRTVRLTHHYDLMPSITEVLRRIDLGDKEIIARYGKVA